MSSQNEDYERISDELAEWRQLLASPAWERLRRIAEGQVRGRIESAGRTPVRSLEDIFEQEFAKGEASGIETFLAIPTTIIEQLEEEAHNLLKVLNGNADTTNDTE